MLIEFRVANYRSFHHEQVFSMVASADKQLPDNLITDDTMGKHNLLRSAVMYGANASGKSNLVKALQFVKEFVEDSAQRKVGSEIPVSPFLFDDESAKEPSRFAVIFMWDEVRYNYTFAVSRHRVEFEELIAYPKGLPQVWYTRKYDAQLGKTMYKFGASFKGERKQIERLTRDDVLYLSSGVNSNNPQLFNPYAWFTEKLDIVDFSVTNTLLLKEGMTASLLAEEESERRLMTALLNLTDNQISEVTVESTNPHNLLDLDAFKVRVHHKIRNGMGSSIDIPLSEESLGTRRLFSLALDYEFAIAHDTVLIIDELDSSLHPLLVRALVALFHHATFAKSRGQLIFNTHDTTLLDSTLFRRDQVWFVEKNLEGASELFSLTDFSARKDESFMRGYLQGRYGAVPYLGELPALLQAILEAKSENSGGKNGKA